MSRRRSDRKNKKGLRPESEVSGPEALAQEAAQELSLFEEGGGDVEVSSEESEELVFSLDVEALERAQTGNQFELSGLDADEEYDVIRPGDLATELSEELPVLAEEEEVVAAEVPAELQGFESAEVEDLEFIEDDLLFSILESILFAADRPLSLDAIKQVFKSTNVKTPMIKKALGHLASELAHPRRGVTLEEVASGYQLRTKLDNVEYLKRMVKARPFKLSGPALEVLSIIAYKQPCTKAEVDEIRGVESGHLLRALMDRGLMRFGDRSDLPGKPMFYETTRKFLEIFGLRNISELPTPSEIDSLIPEGIGEPDPEEKKLSHLTEELSLRAGETYSEGESELLKISDVLSTIDTSSEFFEQEKQRERARRDAERARDIQESLMLGQPVENKDVKWLERYQRSLVAASEEITPEVADVEVEPVPEELLSAEAIVETEAESDEMHDEFIRVEGLTQLPEAES